MEEEEEEDDDKGEDGEEQFNTSSSDGEARRLLEDKLSKMVVTARADLERRIRTAQEMKSRMQQRQAAIHVRRNDVNRRSLDKREGCRKGNEKRETRNAKVIRAVKVWNRKMMKGRKMV
jgi:hypothetical protein